MTDRMVDRPAAESVSPSSSDQTPNVPGSMLAGHGEAVAWETVRRMARGGQPDRYVAALLAPRVVRDDLIALAAFMAELTRIPDQVREPMMGEIRLQWWRDVLPALAASEKSGHPVADRLGRAIVRHGLPTAPLLGMTEAQSFNLYADPFPDSMVARAYFAATEGAAFSLALKMLAPGEAGTSGSVVETAALAGQAYGRAQALMKFPQALAAGRLPLPADQLTAAGVDASHLSADPLPPEANAILRESVAVVRRDLADLRGRFVALTAAQRLAVLPVALIEPQLQAFERQSRESLRTLIEIAPLSRAWRLWRARATGRI